ncbi:MAG: hypothetical protein KBT88_06145 [Gammaproteobacteria bacterium]|nr:hypothetical protein [Gammaproteobacteria bacterium]MBQ0839349.1 hypothetical protein [Gammaproteobacteria bacterium]
MSAFDDYKKDFQAELGSIIKERINAVGWTKKKLNEHRQQALTNMLNHADTHSKWHHEKLKGIDLNSISPDDLSALATMTKEDVQANFDDISTDPKVTKAWCDGHFKAGNFYTDGSYCILASGGSSGHRAMQVYKPKAAAEFAAQILRMSQRLAMHQGMERAHKPLVFIAAAPGAAHATSVIPPLLPGFTSEHAMAVTEPMVEIAAKLNKLQPKALTIYSSYLRHLIQAQEDGLLNISPESISLTSETPSPVDIAAPKKFGLVLLLQTGVRLSLALLA